MPLKRARLYMTATFAAIIVAVITGGIVLHGQSAHIGTIARQNTAIIATDKRQEEKRRELRLAQLRSLHHAVVRDCNGRHRIVEALRHIMRGNAHANPELRPLLDGKLKTISHADCVLVKALPTSVKAK